MKKIIQAVAVLGILAASMGHAVPSFAVMAPTDIDSLCMKYGCTIPPMETIYESNQIQTEKKWGGMIY